METTQLPTFKAMVQVMVDSPVSVECHVRPLPNGYMRCVRTDGKGFPFQAMPEQVMVGSATQQQQPLTDLLTELEQGHAQECATPADGTTHAFYECPTFGSVDEANDPVHDAYTDMTVLAEHLATVPDKLLAASRASERAADLEFKGGPRRLQTAHDEREQARLWTSFALQVMEAAR